MLSIEPHWYELILIQGVDQRVRVDAHRGCVEHNLVDGCQLLEEEEHAGADEDIHLDGSTLDDDPHLKVATSASAARSQVRLRKLRMYQGLIQVKYESLTAAELRGLRRDDCILLRDGLLAEAAGTLQLHQLFWGERQLPLDEHLIGLRSNRPLILLILL